MKSGPESFQAKTVDAIRHFPGDIFRAYKYGHHEIFPTGETTLRFLGVNMLGTLLGGAFGVLATSLLIDNPQTTTISDKAIKLGVTGGIVVTESAINIIASIQGKNIRRSQLNSNY